MDGESRKSESLTEENEDKQVNLYPRRRRLFSFIGFGFIALALLLIVYGSVFDFAWQRGQSLRTEKERLALQEELANQLNFAKEDLKVGSYNLAVRRLDWILERDSDYPEARALRQEALAGGSTQPTPTPFPTATPAPVEELELDESEPAQAFNDLQKIVDDNDWQAAVSAITAFQAQYPDFKRQQTDAMLYNGYINLGQQLVSSDQVELGLFYLTQAENLGDLPIEIQDQRLWAELYLLGISYYGVDWSVAVYYFRDLCAAAPFYHNACLKLHEALISYGDQYAANLDWCPAVDLYAEAAQQNDEPIVSEKLREARTSCLEATPTPTVPITSTEAISHVLPVVQISSWLAS